MCSGPEEEWIFNSSNTLFCYLGLSLLRQKMLEHRLLLAGTVKLRLRRSRIVDDMLKEYESRPQLVFSHVNVCLDEEQAEDLGGPTREAFRLFWEAFCETLCEGRLQRLPKWNHR